VFPKQREQRLLNRRKGSNFFFKERAMRNRSAYGPVIAAFIGLLLVGLLFSGSE
jgi:hypothetical protein